MDYSIDKLMKKLDGITMLLECEAEITKMTPTSIDRVYSRDKGVELKNQIELLNLIYVTPLIQLLNRKSKNKAEKLFQNINLNLLPIQDRILILYNALIKNHIKPKIIMEVIPNNGIDACVLFEAGKQGFNLSFSEYDELSNDDRVGRAKEYLDNLSYQKQLTYDRF